VGAAVVRARAGPVFKGFGRFYRDMNLAPGLHASRLARTRDGPPHGGETIRMVDAKRRLVALRHVATCEFRPP